MALIETIEGVVADRVSFHYDLFADVLYLRLADSFDVQAFGEEDPDGSIWLRTADGRAVGLTVPSFGKRPGMADLARLPMRQIAELIERDLAAETCVLAAA